MSQDQGVSLATLLARIDGKQAELARRRPLSVAEAARLHHHRCAVAAAGPGQARAVAPVGEADALVGG